MIVPSLVTVDAHGSPGSPDTSDDTIQSVLNGGLHLPLEMSQEELQKHSKFPMTFIEILLTIDSPGVECPILAQALLGVQSIFVAFKLTMGMSFKFF